MNKPYSIIVCNKYQLLLTEKIQIHLLAEVPSLWYPHVCSSSLFRMKNTHHNLVGPIPKDYEYICLKTQLYRLLLSLILIIFFSEIVNVLNI